MNNELAFKDNTEKQTVSVDVTATVKNTMTVKEIAQAMGVSTDTVKNCIRRIMPEKMQNGKTTFLNEQEVTMISKELKSNTFVSSHQTYEVSSQVKNTTTRLEVLANYKAATQAMIELLEAEKAELQAENERQAAKIKEDAPLVDFAKAVTESKDCIDIGQAAKVLNVKGVGRNKLFEILREKGVLDRKNQPYQKYVDSGYFRVIETSFCLPDGTQKINLKTLVFQKGLNFIRDVVKETA